MSSLSTFKKRQSSDTSTRKPASPDCKKTLPCPDCGKKFSAFKQKANGLCNSTPHKKCLTCWRSDRQKPPKESQNPKIFSNSAMSADSDEDSVPVVSQFGAIESIYTNRHIISKSDLRRYKHSDHLRVTFKLSKDSSKT